MNQQASKQQNYINIIIIKKYDQNPKLTFTIKDDFILQIEKQVSQKERKEYVWLELRAGK